MKRLALFSLFVTFLITSTLAYAVNPEPLENSNMVKKATLGNSNVAIKIDYIKFTDNDIEDFEVDKGVYIGIEGYTEIIENLYLGLETGYAKPTGQVDVGGLFEIETEVFFIPIELNLKYTVEVVPEFAIGLGAGVSYNYGKGEASAPGSSVSVDDFYFGGQFFADFNYRWGNLVIGANGKYQIMEDEEGSVEFLGATIPYDYNYNNWRVGGHIGVLFD